MFKQSTSPIVADFGAGAVKLLQITDGETPAIVAAHVLEIPDEARGSMDRRFAFLAEELPTMLRQGGFHGRRVICSPSSNHFIVQQTRIEADSPLSADDQVRAEVAGRMECLPASVVARSFPVPSSDRDRVALAVAREDVMRHVDLFRQSRFEVVDVQPDQIPMLRAFDHIHRRAEDRGVVTMYVDAGWGSTKVAVARGTELVFARMIHVGGRQFDEVAAAHWGCTTAEARERRVAEEAVPRPEAVPTAAPDQGSAMLRAGMAKADRDASMPQTAIDRRTGTTCTSLDSVDTTTIHDELHEIHDSVADELLMCSRFAQAVVGGPIDRLVMIGGEAHSRRFAGHLAQRIGVKSSVGDPIRRLLAATPEGAGMLDPRIEHPEWAVACGLCAIGLKS